MVNLSNSIKGINGKIPFGAIRDINQNLNAENIKLEMYTEAEGEKPVSFILD